jgi:hypothetical protein
LTLTSLRTLNLKTYERILMQGLFSYEYSVRRT